MCPTYLVLDVRSHPNELWHVAPAITSIIKNTFVVVLYIIIKPDDESSGPKYVACYKTILLFYNKFVVMLDGVSIKLIHMKASLLQRRSGDI